MSLPLDQFRPRILIVEDNYLMADEVGDLVRGCDFAVAGTAPSLERGLRLVEQEFIDGAVVDISLGGQTSFPLCTALQAKGVPFIFLSGYSPGMMVPAEFRAAPHLSKPVDYGLLQAALQSLIDDGSPAIRLGNLVLDSLPPGKRRTLQAALEPVDLKAGDLLDCAGEKVAHVYFPVDALVSIFPGDTPHNRIEGASIGCDGMTAPGILLGDTMALGETAVQAGGRAWRIPAATLRRLAENDPHMRRHLLGQVGLALRHVLETSAFNGRATIVERLARWLVLAVHRIGSRRLILTHDALSHILGVRRPSVSVALQTLEGQRLIRATRRAILVLDVDGLADVARLKHQSSSRGGGGFEGRTRPVEAPGPRPRAR